MVPCKIKRLKRQYTAAAEAMTAVKGAKLFYKNDPRLAYMIELRYFALRKQVEILFLECNGLSYF